VQGRRVGRREVQGRSFGEARLPVASAAVRCTFVRGCEPAGPFLAKPIQTSFAGSRNPPPSPPARARHCALVGGYMRREQPEQPEQPEQRGQPATVPKVLWLASTALAGMRGPPPHFVGPLHLCAWLRASEPIFSKTHTNEFCGIEKSTPEPAGPCAPLRPGRWVYEKGSRKPCGGDVERLSASAPLRGSLRRPLTVPFLPSPPSRGALRSAGVPTIAASTTPAPLLPWRTRPGPARHLGRLCSGAREYPICAAGWAMWVFGGSPYLFKATGGTYRLGTPQG
jgi:hypothetical protein